MLDGPLLRRDDVGLDALKLLDEAGKINHQILLDREMRERFDRNTVGIVVADEGLAGELNAVDHHAAAGLQMAIRVRPAIGQRARSK